MADALCLTDLLPRYQGVLLDAYGVLVDADGALPGAQALIARLEATAMPYAVVTNDASRSAATCAARFASLGLPIPAAKVITSGMLLEAHLRQGGLDLAATCVLGTDDSRAYARAGGATLVELAPAMHLTCLAICDDAGFDFLRGSEWALSAVMRALDAGAAPHLILPNPDLIYPKRPGEYGFTAGAIALLIEAALVRRYGETAPRFVRLGKPGPALLQLGTARLGVARVLMVGDQLETDIAAANAAGIDAALIAGVSRLSEPATGAPVPTYRISGL